MTASEELRELLERVRDGRVTVEQGVGIMARGIVQAMFGAADEERGRIVAWLRREEAQKSSAGDDHYPWEYPIGWAADRIEANEHRKDTDR